MGVVIDEMSATVQDPPSTSPSVRPERLSRGSDPERMFALLRREEQRRARLMVD